MVRIAPTSAALTTIALVAAVAFVAVAARADTAMAPKVSASDQDVSNGVVSASTVTAAANGWLVIHRTDAAMKPGPVVGHAPLRAGETADVAAILTEPVAPGEMLMLMIHAEDGGMRTGVFEYTLGAKEDGPIRIDGALVTRIVTAK